jgi:hypothetical protein
VHELAHGRTRSVTGRLEGERAAWEFCRANMLVWNAACHALMARCIGSYLANTTNKGDVPEMLRIEELLSPESFARHARPYSPSLPILLEQLEQRLFTEAHGSRPCECRQYCKTPDALALAIDGDRAVCGSCRDARRTERAIRVQRIRRQGRNVTHG